MITINQGESSSYVLINSVEHKMLLKGNSFVSNPNVFYKAITEWGERFKVEAGRKFEIEITMGYFSTSNIQFFNALFKTLNKNNKDKIHITFLLDKDEEEDLEETIYSLVFNTGIPEKIQYL